MPKNEWIDTKANGADLNKGLLWLHSGGTIKFFTEHYTVSDSYRCVCVIREYPPSTEKQAILS